MAEFKGVAAWLAIVVGLAGIAGAQEPGTEATKTLEGVRASSLEGHLAFLASDLLEGRDTPSKGLDLAAEYIAAQFRRAGLETVGDDGYFQVANWELEATDPSTFRMVIQRGEEVVEVPLSAVTIAQPRPMELESAPVVRAGGPGEEGLKALEGVGVEGKVVVLEPAASDAADLQGRMQAMQARRGLMTRLAAMKPAAVVLLEPGGHAGGLVGATLIDPEQDRGREWPSRVAGGPIAVSITDPKLVASLSDMPVGATDAKLGLRIGDRVRRPVKVRNVAGILRGSDPELKDEYVIVSAHYDHIGIGAPTAGDSIYNGANDDGSGTAAVVELAGALAALPKKPKRSILFLTFFGEEKGLLGSRYYGRNPLVPLKDTVAQVNLEQVGRTDDSEGPRIGKGSLTGFDFSEVGTILAEAAREVGADVEKHPRNSDAFFGRSDNQALADVGIPAHTMCTAFMFPDYHGPLDHWEKIDYKNMELIVRAVGNGLLRLANRVERPKWNEANPKTAAYVEAYRKLHAEGSN